jgi:hypothetical protein
MNSKLTLSLLTLLFLLVSNVTVGQEKHRSDTDNESWDDDDDEDWSDYEEVGGDGQIVEIVSNYSEEGQEAEALATQTYDTFSRFTPYYSSVGMVFNLTKQPRLQIGKSDEFDVYKNLFLRSFVPEWATFEFSVYPMPLLGVGLKSNYNSTYNKLELSDTNNLVESVTAGFEEPYSLTLLLNNVTSYNANEKSVAPNVGFMGYLISGGTHHIQRNELIRDNWYELVWKIKGKFSTGPKILSWNFELGTKNHSHNEITDTVFVGIKLDQINYDGPVWSFLENTGFELRYTATQNDLATVDQRFLVTKYFPQLSYKKMIFSLTMGVIHETAQKYSGDLSLNQRSNQTLFVIRPSVYF